LHDGKSRSKAKSIYNSESTSPRFVSPAKLLQAEQYIRDNQAEIIQSFFSSKGAAKLPD